jgi:hypothetical protein
VVDVQTAISGDILETADASNDERHTTDSPTVQRVRRRTDDVRYLTPDVGEWFDVTGTLARVTAVDDDESTLVTEDGRVLYIPNEILLRRFGSIPISEAPSTE